MDSCPCVGPQPDSCPCVNLTAVKCNVIVLCNVCKLHTREMLLSLPTAAAAAHCSSATAVLHKCNWCGYVITEVRLHSCTLPVLLLKLLLKPLLWLGLAWVEEFKLSLSLELASLGYLGLGTLNKYFHGKLNQLSSFAYCSYISPLV